MKYTYDTCGAVCAASIDVELDADNKVVSVVFHGGCPGNHLGIAALVKGMDAKEAAKRLAGIRCGARNTSCPDQLSKALEDAIRK